MKHFISIVSLGVLLSACSDSKYEGFTKAESGLHYKFFTHDENGTTAKEGDGVLMRFKITNYKNDSVIVNSVENSRDGSGCVKYLMRNATFKGSFEEGLMMMCKGDSAAFVVSADSFFLKSNGMNQLPKGINPGDMLKGVFKIADVTPAKVIEEQRAKQKAEMEAMAAQQKELEMPAIENYIKEHKITVKPTASGLYYMEIKKGNGPSPKATDMVTVHYTGKLLDGKVFDSSVQRGQPAEFPLNGVIPGWTEALQLMKKGGKAELIIPSAIAYGERGASEMIKPYTPLFFEVELLDIKPGRDQNTQAPTPTK